MSDLAEVRRALLLRMFQEPEHAPQLAALLADENALKEIAGPTTGNPGDGNEFESGSEIDYLPERHATREARPTAALTESRLDIGHWRVGNHTVRLVDDAAIRNHHNVEFDLLGTHVGFPKLIPPGEIWVGTTAKPEERRFFVDHGLAQLHAMEAGKSPLDAYDIGLKREKAERHKASGGIADEIGDPNHVIVGEMPCDDPDIEVKLVDGVRVRNEYKTEFVEGGNWMAYKWVPRHQIWIDAALSPSERRFTLIHELTEAQLMRDRGLDYTHAHERANTAECDARHGPPQPREKVAVRESREITKIELLEAVGSIVEAVRQSPAPVVNVHMPAPQAPATKKVELIRGGRGGSLSGFRVVTEGDADAIKQQGPPAKRPVELVESKLTLLRGLQVMSAAELHRTKEELKTQLGDGEHDEIVSQIRGAV